MSELLNRIDLRFDFVSSKLALHVITPGGCWEYQGQKSTDGYGKFQIYAPGIDPKKRKYRAHRVSYAYHYGVDPGEMLVCHKCDNPSCINPDHLFLGTEQQNTQDKMDKGRHPPQYGEHNPRALVTEAVVLSIVEAIKKGLSNKQIAEGLPVSHSQVSLIRLGKSWRRITEAAGYNPDDHRVFKRKTAA